MSKEKVKTILGIILFFQISLISLVMWYISSHDPSKQALSIIYAGSSLIAGMGLSYGLYIGIKNENNLNKNVDKKI